MRAATRGFVWVAVILLAAIAVAAQEEEGVKEAMAAVPTLGNVTENMILAGVRSQIDALNLSDLSEGLSGTSAVPMVLTRLASNWLNSTYACMLEYYSVSKHENQTVADFVSKIATSAIEDIVQPGVDLCLSS